MADLTPTNGFVGFPDYIVPPSPIRIEKMYEEVKVIDDRIAANYAKLHRIEKEEKETLRPVGFQPYGGADAPKTTMHGKAYNEVSKKINQQLERKRAIYSENEQWRWAKQYIDAGISYSQTCVNPFFTQMYQYASARVNENEFGHITNLYAGEFGKQLPAYIRQVNQIPAIINRLVGEADSMGLKFSVGVSNSDAINNKLEEYAEEMAEKMTRKARQVGGVDKLLGKPLEQNDQWQFGDDEDLGKMSFTEYKTDKEVMVKRGLDYLMKKNKNAIRYKMSHMGFRNYIVTGILGFEIYDAVDDPDIQAINAGDIYYILSPESNFIQDGSLAGRYMRETPANILAMCPELPAEDAKKLKMYAAGLDLTGRPMTASYINECGQVFVRTTDMARPLMLNGWKQNWMATKMVRVKMEENKYDLENPHLKYVDDNDNTEGATYVYRYVDELWEGTRWGSDIYYQVRPVPNQHIVGDYVERKTLNFVGIVDPNPSIVQLAQPFEALRVETFFAIEKLMAQVKGKILTIDEANEADGADNAYNMAVHATYRYNSAKEGDQQLMNIAGSKHINKPEAIDLGLSSAINDLLRFVAFLDMNIANITGITGARKGELKSDTGLGQMQESTLASSMSTQPYFTVLYTVEAMVLEKLCEQMGRTWAGKDIVRSWLGDDGYETLRLMSKSDWNLARYGVTIENGANDAAVQQKIYQMAEALMPIQNEPEMARALIKIMNATSAKEAERIFDKGIDALNKIKAKVSEGEAQQAQAEQQMKAKELETKVQLAEIAASSAPQAAQINAQAKIEDTQLKLEHKENAMSVKKKDDVDLMIASHELEHNKPVTSTPQ